MARTGSSRTARTSPLGLFLDGFQRFGVVILTAALPLFGAILHHGLADRLAYPPMSDQRMYLAGGMEFAERFLFFWRAPLYGAWIGIFHIASGGDPAASFHFEKLTTLLLLGLLVAYLGRLLFDVRTGLLLGVWVLNCKYLVLETNGSHMLAACLFVGSFLCFFIRDRRARLPAALLTLFLSTQVRSEMWIPFCAIVLSLLVLAVKDRVQGKGRVTSSLARERSYWVGGTIVAMGLSVLFYARATPPESHRFAEAFAMNFAMNYVDRNHLTGEYTAPDLPYTEIWVRALPGVSSSADAIERDRGELHLIDAFKRYPSEMLAHVLYNISLSVRGVPAMFLAFDRPMLMLIAFMVYIGSFVVWRRPGPDRWKSLPENTKRLLVVWSLEACLLIPITLIFRVVARYYIPFAPVAMVFAVFVVRAVLSKVVHSRAGSAPSLQVETC